MYKSHIYLNLYTVTNFRVELGHASKKCCALEKSGEHLQPEIFLAGGLGF